MGRIARAGGIPTLGEEVLDCLHYLLHPRPGPRLKVRSAGAGLHVDFALNAPWWRIVSWAVVLWLVNLMVFAPLALSAAQAAGAVHRLNVQHLPWLTALIWAPVIEELTFRYVLRRPAVLWWFVPLMAIVLAQGPGVTSGMIAVLAFLLAMAPLWYGRGHRWQRAWTLSWAGRRWVCRAYPWFFHVVALAFAAVHLFNFRLNDMELFLLPLLVLPQWVTGLVLGWMRVRRGIGASMCLHAVFNAGPLLVLGLLLHFAPELAVG
ncbi:MAG TPA: CPBP family glutamic-type intramembrane protease [Castellaniella sp.]|uniref:CPBP family glutamic-type intramembrane protease n=1 Tax=Castellaniella sp. TaxID=1955812 RepID=UPI002F1C8296